MKKITASSNFFCSWPHQNNTDDCISTLVCSTRKIKTRDFFSGMWLFLPLDSPTEVRIFLGQRLIVVVQESFAVL